MIISSAVKHVLAKERLFSLAFAARAVGSSMSSTKDAASIYDFSAKDIDGNEVSMDRYKDKALVIVNVASKCNTTKSNYEQLQQLYDRYQSKGLCIAAFPCNQFANEEPGSEEEIKKFVKENFNVSFDMYSKVAVNGSDAHPLWLYLRDKLGGTMGSFIKWNFTKFLVDKAGQPIKRFGPNEDPQSMEKDILHALGISTGDQQQQ